MKSVFNECARLNGVRNPAPRKKAKKKAKKRATAKRPKQLALFDTKKRKARKPKDIVSWVLQDGKSFTTQAKAKAELRRRAKVQAKTCQVAVLSQDITRVVTPASTLEDFDRAFGTGSHDAEDEFERYFGKRNPRKVRVIRKAR